MKLNFEKTKRIAQNTVGAGVVLATAIFPTEKALGQQVPVIDTTKTSNFDDPESYRKKYLDNMNDPSYKKRLVQEMFTGKTRKLTDSQKIELDKEFNERIERIKSVNIKLIPQNDSMALGGTYDPSKNLIETTTYSANHELSHKAEGSYGLIGNSSKEKGFTTKRAELIDSPEEMMNKFRNSKEYVNAEKVVPQIMDSLWNDIQNEYLKPNAPKFLMNKYGEGFNTDITTEEGKDFVKNLVYLNPFMVVSDINDSIFVNKHKSINKDKYDIYDLYLKKLNEEDIKTNYFNLNTEVKARINNLRMKAFEDYGYKFNKKFNINNYPKLKERADYKQLKKYLEMTDDDINELSKYIAMGDGENNYYNPNWNYGDQNNSKA